MNEKWGSEGNAANRCMTRGIMMFLILLSFSHFDVIAQPVPEKKQMIHFRDSIFVDLGVSRERWINYKVPPKETLFSIAQSFGLSIEQLYKWNPDLKEKMLPVGYTMKIPLPAKSIVRFRNTGFYRWKFAPLFYVVKPGESIYKIAKEHFSIPVDTICTLSKITNKVVTEGQRLQIGWISTQGIPDSLQGKPSGEQLNVEQKMELLKDKFSAENATKWQESQGVAFWMKGNKENKDLYALHREAAVNSVIAITNPMRNVTVYARVIDRIPEGTNSGVEVVLSPAAARMLGARNPKFFVKLRYKKG